MRDDGLLVIRVPDADFYTRESRLDVLARNGLLGWPHRLGYGVENLCALVLQHGFTFVRTLRRPAILPVIVHVHETEHGWIELTFRSSL